MVFMVRTNTQIHPARTPAPLRAAATVLLLRDTAHGIEVLMTRRSMTASFAPGVYVFPGGGIDDLDKKHALGQQNRAWAAIELVAPNMPAEALTKVATRSTQTTALCAEALAAIRESFEELGILLAKRDGKDGDARWVTQADINALDRTAPFYAQMQTRGYTLAADTVFTLARWVTDRDMSKRFDVPFLVARMPPGQTPVADEAEQFEPLWISPAQALARHKAKDFLIIFPTIRTLERLLAFTTVDAVLQACATEQPLWTCCPRAGMLGGKEERYMEHEAPFGELALVCPDGQIVHELQWQHDKPVQLLKHVMRLTAPNPGMMTGPGTNTYIVGTPDTGCVVIDPGPYDMAHVQRIFDATQGDINAIVCTHSHADHSPAAKPLQALVIENSHTVPGALMGTYARHMCPILGLPSAATARTSAEFEPDAVLQNKELLTLYFRAPEVENAENTFNITLQAIHTPGHAANHLCLVLQEDGLLFSGDHILNGSTTVIDPPDGNMTHYMESLDVLAAACVQHSVHYILPAHGYVIGAAPDAIAHLKVHRLKREAKVRHAMHAMPDATVEELVPLAYDDVDARLWPIAARSLLAHVEKLQREMVAK
jgi:recombination protein RecT